MHIDIYMMITSNTVAITVMQIRVWSEVTFSDFFSDFWNVF